jgi:hypothetical protein
MTLLSHTQLFLFISWILSHPTTLIFSSRYFPVPELFNLKGHQLSTGNARKNATAANPNIFEIISRMLGKMEHHWNHCVNIHTGQDCFKSVNVK